MLFLLSVVQTGLNGELLLFLLLSVLAAQLLGPFFGATSMNTAAAPKEDEEEHGEAEDDNYVLQNPIAK